MTAPEAERPHRSFPGPVASLCHPWLFVPVRRRVHIHHLRSRTLAHANSGTEVYQHPRAVAALWTVKPCHLAVNIHRRSKLPQVARRGNRRKSPLDQSRHCLRHLLAGWVVVGWEDLRLSSVTAAGAAAAPFAAVSVSAPVADSLRAVAGSWRIAAVVFMWTV